MNVPIDITRTIAITITSDMLLTLGVFNHDMQFMPIDNIGSLKITGFTLKANLNAFGGHGYGDQVS
ncbi:hypothetical protein D3C79_952460 [compost metagenome]